MFYRFFLPVEYITGTYIKLKLYHNNRTFKMKTKDNIKTTHLLLQQQINVS